MKLILTRHGETIENIEGIFQGRLPGKLSQLGIEEAKKLAERFKEEKIDVIYSSSLARAADTAKEIIKFHPKVPIEYTDELMERDIGELQGKKESEVVSDKKIRDITDLELEPKKGESLEQLYTRAKQFLDKIFQKHIKDTVLIVGHNGINKAILCVIMNKKPEEIPELEKFKNTSVTIVEIDENKKYTINLFNCTKHKV